MAYEDFHLLHVDVGGRVCGVTIDNPPINLLDLPPEPVSYTHLTLPTIYSV